MRAWSLLNFVSILMVCCGFSAAEDKKKVELPPFCIIEIADGWDVYEQGQNSEKGCHWLILKKGGDEEYLSYFAGDYGSFGRSLGEELNVEYFGCLRAIYGSAKQ